MANIGLKRLNAGELTPKIDARDDLEKYDGGLRHAENVLPTVWGPDERRPGTEFIYEAKQSPQGIRLFPFIYSSTIAYMCEFGDQYARFYFDGAILLDGSDDPVEVTTGYLVDDLPAVQTSQIADVMWMAHKSYAQAKLTRTSVTAFSHDDITFKTGPFRLRNDLIDPDDLATATMTASVIAKDDTGTLTASAATFEVGHVGGLFALTQPRVNTIITRSGAGISDAIDVKGTFRFVTREKWSGTVRLQRNENSAGWEDFRTYKSGGNNNYQLTHVETSRNVQYRIRANADVSGGFRADLNVNNSEQIGIVRVDSFVSTTVVNITVLSAIASTDATRRWAEGSWSRKNGSPAAVTFYGNRCIYAGTDSEPGAIWLSAVDDYEIFEAGTNASDSFAIPLTTTNEIKWVSGTKRGITVGTSGGNWIVSSNDINTPLTPTNWTATEQPGFGSAPVGPVQINDTSLFVDQNRRRIMEYAFDTTEEGYGASDMTILAEHITETGIVAVAL